MASQTGTLSTVQRRVPELPVIKNEQSDSNDSDDDDAAASSAESADEGALSPASRRPSGYSTFAGLTVQIVFSGNLIKNFHASKFPSKFQISKYQRLVFGCIKANICK